MSIICLGFIIEKAEDVNWIWKLPGSYLFPNYDNICVLAIITTTLHWPFHIINRTACLFQSAENGVSVKIKTLITAFEEHIIDII